MSIELREYQLSAVSDILDAIKNQKNTILQLPTGTGKTTVFAEVIRQWRANNSRALVVVHRKELIDQVIERLYQFGIKAGRIQAGEVVNEEYQIQVGLIQSLTNNKRKPASLGLIIVDEAHHITANSYQNLIRYYDNYKPTIIGVTATPSRLDGQPLGDTFSQLLEYGQVQWFIDKNYLSPMKHFATGSPDLSQIRVKNTGDYEEKALQEEMSKELVMANLIDGYKKHADGKKAIVFAVNTEHAQIIADRYNSNGYSAIALDYKTDAETRKRSIEKFKRGEITILCNVNLFTEGFDCPNVEVVQLARPTKSLNLYLQMVGRGMRIFPGKSKGIILDNAKLWEAHGLCTRNRIWDLNGLLPEKQSYKVIEKGKEKSEREPNQSKLRESDELELIEVVEDNLNEKIEISNTLITDYSKFDNYIQFPEVIRKMKIHLEFHGLYGTYKLEETNRGLTHSLLGTTISSLDLTKLAKLNTKTNQSTIGSKKLFNALLLEMEKYPKEFDIAYQLLILTSNYIKNIETFNNAQKDNFNSFITILKQPVILNTLRINEDLASTIKTSMTYDDLYNLELFFQNEFHNTLRPNLEKLDEEEQDIDMYLENNSILNDAIVRPTEDSNNELEDSNKEFRLAKVSSQLNKSSLELAEYLNSLGFNIEPRPMSKISHIMYLKLIDEFSKPVPDNSTNEKSYRLIKVAQELQLPVGRIIDVLSSYGHQVNPASKISAEMYNLLLSVTDTIKRSIQEENEIRSQKIIAEIQEKKQRQKAKSKKKKKKK